MTLFPNSWVRRVSSTRFLEEEKKEFSLINLGKKFNSSYLLVAVNTSSKKDSWDFGGTIYPAYLVFGKYTYVAKFELRIDNQNLITVPLLFEGKFYLFYKPPNWFTQFNIKIYEYVKIVENSAEKIENRLTILENKIETDLALIKEALGIKPPIEVTTEQIEFFLFN